MTREPLMLSDTAMVLLREHIEMKDHFQTVYKILNETKPDIFAPFYDEFFHWERRHNYAARLIRSKWMLLQEIAFLYLYQDLQPVRHLGWHLVFDEHLMSLAAEVFADSRRYPTNGSVQGFPAEAPESILIDNVTKHYKKVLAIRAQTKTTP